MLDNPKICQAYKEYVDGRIASNRTDSKTFEEWSNRIFSNLNAIAKQAESEKLLKNFGAAEIFTQKLENDLEKYGITLEEIQKLEDVESNVTKFINELGVTVIPNPFQRINAKAFKRTIWFERLSEIIAEGYYCKAFPDKEKGEVKLFGFDLDREMAQFMILRIAIIAQDLQKSKFKLYKSEIGKDDEFDFGTGETLTYPKVSIGDSRFIASFHNGFKDWMKEFFSNHKYDLKKKVQVGEFFNQNKGDNDYYYLNHEEQQEENLFNEISDDYVYKMGKNAARIALKKAQSSNNSLTGLQSKKINSIIPQDDVVYILLDKSGSMQGESIEQAKKGTIEYAKIATQKGFATGLILFGHNVQHIFKPTREINGKFSAAIEKVEANGHSTNLKEAIKCARMYFTNRRVKRTICVITDGYPDDINGTLNEANDAKRDGIEIMAIGTDGANQEFLDKLVSREGLGLLVDRSQLLLGIGSMAEKL